MKKPFIRCCVYLIVFTMLLMFSIKAEAVPVVSTNNNRDVIVFDSITMYDSLTLSKSKLQKLGFIADPNPFQSVFGAYTFHAPKQMKQVKNVLLMSPGDSVNLIAITINKGKNT